MHITPAAVFSPSAASPSSTSSAAAAVASAAPPRPAPSTPVASLRVIDIVRSIHAKEGWKGFTRGMAARVLYFTPSAAICWTTYEAMKALLKD